MRKRLAGLLLHQLLVVRDHGLQVFRVQVGIQLDLALGFTSIEHFIERMLAHVQHHVAEHLDEAAVAIVRKAFIAALGDQTAHGLVVQAQVQDGVHHARHAELCAGADADQQRVLRIAQLLAHALFKQRQRLVYFLLNLVRRLVAILEIHVADLRRNGETGGHGQPRARHLRQACTLAAQRVFHLAVAIGGTRAE